MQSEKGSNDGMNQILKYLKENIPGHVGSVTDVSKPSTSSGFVSFIKFFIHTNDIGKVKN